MSHQNFIDRLNSIREKYGCLQIQNKQRLCPIEEPTLLKRKQPTMYETITRKPNHNTQYHPTDNPQLFRPSSLQKKNSVLEFSNHREDRIRELDLIKENYKGIKPHYEEIVQKKLTLNEPIKSYLSKIPRIDQRDHQTPNIKDIHRIQDLDHRISEKQRILTNRIAQNQKKLKDSYNFNNEIKSTPFQVRSASLNKNKQLSHQSSHSKLNALLINKENTMTEIFNKKINDPYTSDNKPRLQREIVLRENIDYKQISKYNSDMSPVKLLDRKDSQIWSSKKENNRGAYKHEGDAWNLNNLDRIQQRIQSILHK